MRVTTRSTHLRRYLQAAREQGQTIGFVPTMGALHRGHISLIELSGRSCDLTISSLFVNPTQFNNPDDLKKYPRTTEKDLDMLEEAGCDIVFLPSVEEIYPAEFKAEHYELGSLDHILEGAFRPGHFQGVCMVVDRLLSLTEPDVLFLGKKDYQQCMVISKMIELKNHKTRVIICPTIREDDGLAMSSRNMRLSVQEREKSAAIFRTLHFLKDHLQPGDLREIKKAAVQMLEKAGFRVEYVEIADAGDLSGLDAWDGNRKTVGLVAAYMGDVRLIDNLDLF